MTAPSAIKADSTSSQGDYLGHQRIYQTGIFHSENVFNPKHILLLEKTSKRRAVARSFKERDKHCTNRSFVFFRKVLTICSNLSRFFSPFSNQHWFWYRGYRHCHRSHASCCSGAAGHPGHFPLLLQVSGDALPSMRCVYTLLSTLKASTNVSFTESRERPCACPARAHFPMTTWQRNLHSTTPSTRLE